MSLRFPSRRSLPALLVACVVSALWVLLALAQAPNPATNLHINAGVSAPTLTLLNPSSGAVGASVTITGTLFNAVQGSGTVRFNGALATVTSWTATSITATVPATATTGSVVVTQNSLASNGLTFTVTGGGGGGCVGTAPQICGESGTLTNGSTLTITGSGFGSKSTPAPAAYEQFEQAGYKPGVWSDTLIGTSAIQATNQRSAFSTKNMLIDFTPSLNTGQMTANLSTAAKWFVSYWYYLDAAFRQGNEFVPPESGGHDCNLANTKVMRFSSPSWSNGDHDTIMNYDTNDNNRVTGQSQSYDDIAGLPSHFGTVSTWHRLDVQLQSESGASTNDGSIRIYFDGTLYYTNTSFDTQTSGFTGNMRPYGISFWNSWGGCSTPTHDLYYQDDTYMDNTWARVEIGDGATFATRGHTELQVPSSWSSTSIQVTLSQASLSGFSGKYIYVIDSNGNVNSTGFQIP